MYIRVLGVSWLFQTSKPTYFKYFFKLFFKVLVIYLKCIVTETQRQRERSSICWFTPQVAAMARATLIQNQEPGASSRSPTHTGTRAQGHGPSSTFSGHNRELDWKRAARTQSDAHMDCWQCRWWLYSWHQQHRHHKCSFESTGHGAKTWIFAICMETHMESLHPGFHR